MAPGKKTNEKLGRVWVGLGYGGYMECMWARGDWEISDQGLTSSSRPAHLSMYYHAVVFRRTGEGSDRHRAKKEKKGSDRTAGEGGARGGGGGSDETGTMTGTGVR